MTCLDSSLGYGVLFLQSALFKNIGNRGRLLTGLVQTRKTAAFFKNIGTKN